MTSISEEIYIETKVGLVKIKKGKDENYSFFRKRIMYILNKINERSESNENTMTDVIEKIIPNSMIYINKLKYGVEYPEGTFEGVVK